MKTQKQESNVTERPDPTPPVEKAKRTTPTLEFLPVAYTDSEIVALADSLARYAADKERLEEQFECIKLDFKSKIEAVDNSVKSIGRKIRTRSHYENVDCFYMLEDPTPGEKTLVRRDTGEIVRVVPMDARDYQDPLPLAMKPDTTVDNTRFSLTPATDGKAAAASDTAEARPQ